MTCWMYKDRNGELRSDTVLGFHVADHYDIYQMTLAQDQQSAINDIFNAFTRNTDYQTSIRQFVESIDVSIDHKALFLNYTPNVEIFEAAIGTEYFVVLYNDIAYMLEAATFHSVFQTMQRKQKSRQNNEAS